MAEQKKKIKALPFIIIGAVVVLAGAGIGLGLGLNKNNPLPTETEEETTAAEKNWLVEALAKEGDETIEVKEDVVLPEIAFVTGKKTFTGSGTISGAAGEEYIIVVQEGASLVLDGPTLDGTDGAKNGVYVSPNATFELKNGGIKNIQGHAIRVLNTATISGGVIDTCGEDFVMVDANAKLSVTGGEMKNATGVGIITGEGSETELLEGAKLDGSEVNLIQNGGTLKIEGAELLGAEDYTILNTGKVTVTKTKFTGNTVFGYFQNEAGGVIEITDSEMADSKGDYIYNMGEITMENITFGVCQSNAFENKGNNAIFNLKNATMESVGRGVFLNRAGTMNIEDVTVGECGEFFVHNRAAYFNGKNIKAENVGGIAFFNDNAAEKDETGAKDITVDGFEIGFADNYGARNSGGTMILKNGTMGKCTSYGLYVYDGEVTIEGCKFLGTTDPARGVIQVGLSTRRTGKLTVNDTEITGGARGITNQSELIFNSGKIYGNKSAGSATVGAGINNQGTATINGGTITGNVSLSSGGGIYNGGTMVINNVTVTGNISQASGGGIAGKGTLTINYCKVTNNLCANYGGGLYNTGALMFRGGYVSGNTANKGGGGFYSSGSSAITGGSIINNKVADGKNGANVYSSGETTLAGGNIASTTEKPYDLYIYRNNLTIQGAPQVLSIYKATDGKLTIGKEVKTENIILYANSYSVGTQVLFGKAEKIAESNEKFVLPDAEAKLDKYIDDTGVITMEGIDLDAKEAKLIRDGKVIEEGALLLALKSAQNGDTIQLISDVTIQDTIELSQNRQITLTDDGTKRTVTLATTEKAAFYVFGALSTETRATVNFVGTKEGGLEFVGCEANTAQILLSDFATLNVTGNVTFKNFTNICTDGSSSKTGRTSKKMGAVFFIFNVTTANLNLEGTTIEDCEASGRGAAIYLQQKIGKVTLKDVTITGEDAINTSETCGIEIGGLMKLDSVYTASPIVITEALAEGSELKVNLEKYLENTVVLSTELDDTVMKDAVEKTTILNSEEEDPATYLLGEDGVMEENPEAKIPKEAELYDENGKLVSTAEFVTQVAAAQNGYTIKLISDVELTAPLELTNRTFTITDDGTKRTVKLADATACLYVRGTKSANAVVVIEGTEKGGIVFMATKPMTTAAVTMWQYSNLTVQGNVTFQNFSSACTEETEKNESNKTSGSLGSVFFINASQSAYLTVKGATVKNCSSAFKGTLIYNLGYHTVFEDCTFSASTCDAGSLVYNDNGGTGRDLTLKNCVFTNNTLMDQTASVIYNGGILRISGKTVFESIYLDKPMTVEGALTSNSSINVKMGSFTAGTSVYDGDAELVKAAVKANVTTLLDNNGKTEDQIELILGESGALESKTPSVDYEAEAKSGTVVKGTGTLQEMLTLAIANGYTVVLKKDATLTSCVASVSKGKSFTLTDDGTAHTITVSPDGSKAAFFLYAGKSAPVVFSIVGTEKGGLTIQGADKAEFKSAAFVVCQYSTLNVSGNVTVQNFKNTATGTAAPTSSNYSSAGRGAAFSQASSGSATMNLTDTTIKNCTTALNGAGFYCYNWNSTLTNVTITGCKAAKNGGGVFVSTYPSGTSTVTYRKLVMASCTVAGNTSEANGQDVAIDTSATLVISGKMVIGELYAGTPFQLGAALTEGAFVGVKLPTYAAGTEVATFDASLSASVSYLTLLENADDYSIGTDGKLAAK